MHPDPGSGAIILDLHGSIRVERGSKGALEVRYMFCLLPYLGFYAPDKQLQGLAPKLTRVTHYAVTSHGFLDR